MEQIFRQKILRHMCHLLKLNFFAFELFSANFVLYYLIPLLRRRCSHFNHVIEGSHLQEPWVDHAVVSRGQADSATLSLVFL